MNSTYVLNERRRKRNYTDEQNKRKCKRDSTLRENIKINSKTAELIERTFEGTLLLINLI